MKFWGGILNENVLRVSLWEYNGVDLAVVIHKMDLQALFDVVW